MRGKAAVRRTAVEIEPDEIFLDSSNLPSLDPTQLEGRVEKPVSRVTLVVAGALFLLIVGIFGFRTYDLQIVQGAQYAAASDNNRLSHSLVFAERGVIYDRTGMELAWNEASDELPYAKRAYLSIPGLSHVVGYMRYPKADSAGIWWRTELAGVSGAEAWFNEGLTGINGYKIVEVDALGDIQREHIVEPSVGGSEITLSIDAGVQSKLASVLSNHARTQGFRGGAAVIMDIHTGELIAATSFPEYSQEAMTEGDAEAIRAYSESQSSPFLFRATAGAYTPGSIVKPFLAAAALNEGTITPQQSILSTGALTIPNPYNPDQPSIFKDWKAHGWTNMREAIAVSSDVYFYQVGGGFEGQQGLGISRIDEYFSRFGFGKGTGSIFPDEVRGIIPTPEWKEEVFDGDPWRLGDTYITSIGQYGMQVTPIQAVRAIAALANGGNLMRPTIVRGAMAQSTPVGIPDQHLQVAREGMRLAVTSEIGTARSLNIFGMEIAGKTGTAELGYRNEFMNSWVVGFWPYENPRYAFAVVLEHAPAGTLSGAAPGISSFFHWLIAEKSEYARGTAQ